MIGSQDQAAWVWLRSHVCGLLAHQREGDGSPERDRRALACNPLDIQARGAGVRAASLQLHCSCIELMADMHEVQIMRLCLTAGLGRSDAQDI